MSRDVLLLLEDIETSCAKIIRYADGLPRDQVFADEMRFDGILFNLHVIGEAVKKLPLDLREKHSDVAWREIAGLRDFVAHAYFALDLDILWDAIQRDVPALLDRVREIASKTTPTAGCNEN
ncbi:MAG TPA: DUF86 domain-containing protein [Thermoanaerobaculia bacterium]